jgi:hypothetical protein
MKQMKRLKLKELEGSAANWYSRSAYKKEPEEWPLSLTLSVQFSSALLSPASWR